jgi:NitT/TauT family transport system ATP-binding protein
MAGDGAAPQLRVEGVSIRYDGEQRQILAVDDVSFRVHRGEKFILLGPSGCGKSTLLKAIAGFMPAFRGTIELDGRTVTEPGPDRVVVFQEFDQLLPWKTVVGNVAYALAAAGACPKAELASRADRFVNMVGLEGFKTAYPYTLSGGMKQRVAIARSLALDPAILLMDEPFASLDALTRTRMQDELNAIWRQTGKTIIFVTHSIQEAVMLGHRILVMTAGPGRVKALLENRAAGHDLDSPQFVAMQQEIRGLLEHATGERGSQPPAPDEPFDKLGSFDRLRTSGD